MIKKIILLKDFFTLSLILSLFFILPSCDDTGVLPIFQTSYDSTLGAELNLQIKADNINYPLLNNASATQYLQGIINEIIKSPEMLYANTFHYKVEIINSNVINAFATPGGNIYVYKGLLKYLESEAELAAILAHEVAHADRRHAVQRIQKQYGISFLTNLFLPDNAGQLTIFATELLTELTFLKNSRDDEFEADKYSFKYLLSTKWYPGAGKEFFNRMLKESNTSTNIFEEFFSTHPTDSKRIEQLDNLIKSSNIGEPTEENLFKAKYATFKASI